MLSKNKQYMRDYNRDYYNKNKAYYQEYYKNYLHNNRNKLNNSNINNYELNKMSFEKTYICKIDYHENPKRLTFC